MPASQVRKPLFLSLTGIRIFLAFWVISYHLMFSTDILNITPAMLPGLLNNFFRTAYAAVETFFILSGFVLATNYSSSSWWTSTKLWDFASARFARIYPIYAVSLVLAAPFAYASMLKDGGAGRIVRHAGIAAAHWTLLQAWIPAWSLEWNTPAWSLSAEISFYTLFPLVSVLLWRQSRWAVLAVIGLTFWLMALVAPAVITWMPSHPFAGISAVSANAPDGWLANFIKFNPVLRVFDFLLGIWAGRIFVLLQARNINLDSKGYWIYFPGIAMYLLAASFGDHIPFFFFNNGLLAPALLLIVFGLALGGGFVDRILSHPWVVKGGELSYCIYLFQDPVLSMLRAIEKRLFPGTPKYLFVAISTTILVATSYAAVEMIEKPLNRLLRKRLQSKPKLRTEPPREPLLSRTSSA